MATAIKPSKADQQLRTMEFLIDKKRYRLTYEQAFALGHQLWRRNKPRESARVLQKLCQWQPDCQGARLLFARGLARLGRYDSCNELLQAAFADIEGSLAAQVQDALVMWTLGERKEAIRDLTTIARDHDDLPSICLILGDLWEQSGDHERACALWALAARRADRRGPIAYSARCQIATLRQPRSRSNLTSIRARPHASQAGRS